MNLVNNPTVTSAAEASVIRMQQEATAAMESLRNATVEAFRNLWGDLASTQAKLDVIGTGCVGAFLQHERSVIYLLTSGIALDPADYTPPVAYKAHEDGTITLD